MYHVLAGSTPGLVLKHFASPMSSVSALFGGCGGLPACVLLFTHHLRPPPRGRLPLFPRKIRQLHLFRIPPPPGSR